MTTPSCETSQAAEHRLTLSKDHKSSINEVLAVIGGNGELDVETLLKKCTTAKGKIDQEKARLERCLNVVHGGSDWEARNSYYGKLRVIWIELGTLLKFQKRDPTTMSRPLACKVNT